MESTSNRRPPCGIRKKLATAVLIAAAGGMGSSVAIANSVDVDLQLMYSCEYPLIGVQPLSADISSHMPLTIPVNEPTGAFDLNIVATAMGNTWTGLNIVSATTIEGMAYADSNLSGNNLNLDLTVPMIIDQQPVPPSAGDFDLIAYGETPSLTFMENNEGEVIIAVEDNLRMAMIARRADGSYVDFGGSWHSDPDNPEAFIVSCAVDAGQDQELHRFTVGGDTPTEPRISVTPDELDFGNVQGGLTVTESVTVSNTGGAELGINNITLAGPDAGAFSESNDCTTVAAGDSCTIDVTFYPVNEDSFSAELVIESNDAEEPSVSVALMGSSVMTPTPEITVNPESVSFGMVQVGDAATQTVTIGNTGLESLFVDSISITGSEASEFIENNDCTTVAPDATCAITISFSPTATGNRAATLEIESNAADTATLVPLSGQGSTGGGNTVDFPMSLTGESFIKKPHGTVPLTGGIQAVLDLATGDFVADLTLDPSHGEFEILYPLYNIPFLGPIMGWITSDADVEFEMVGQTTGTLVDGVLTAHATMYIKLPRVRVIGLGIPLPIGGGDECRTSEAIEIELKTPEGEQFDPFLGGNLEATYTLPPVENCGGWFDGFINMFMAGPDNTIHVSLEADL
ncbi:choice-of-anchor D domain-containing protein [Alcanivorax sp. JB21]|nr:choice-of-anchor D domain-containing protein [Alcanivorax limicola]